MASLQTVLQVLSTLRGGTLSGELLEDPPITFDTGGALLAEHANAILGPSPAGRETRIMITMPGEAADDPGLIKELVAAGMGIMRINCAHDSPKIWGRMVKHLRRAERHRIDRLDNAEAAFHRLSGRARARRPMRQRKPDRLP